MITGEGSVSIGKDSAPIRGGDAVPVFLNEVHAFENTVAQDLELMIVGVARAKWALDTIEEK